MTDEFHMMPTVSHTLFGDRYELIPSVNEVFELEMAHLEFRLLSEKELVDRSAFFKSINGEFTKHYLLCSGQGKWQTKNESARTKAYFENGQFSTGYATHSLFPYRGKFHPQLIKGLINIIGIKEGETIIDPMCGSGTTNIEAALLGINSFAVDISPFCQFMTKAKYDALTIRKDLLGILMEKQEKLFRFFCREDIGTQMRKIDDQEKLKVYELGLLAFLDSMGYSKRVIKWTHEQLFGKVLERYVSTIESFIDKNYFGKARLGVLKVLGNCSALELELANNSVDGIITSPPYSFAIDYVKNDEAQLQYLGYKGEVLRSRMIGLRGSNKKEQLKIYFEDMADVCCEMKRILKMGKYFVLIIGSNTNQTGGIRLETTITKNCERMGLALVKDVLKPIKGMRNTMKEEHILFFRKEKD